MRVGYIPPGREVLYRVDGVCYSAGVDEWENPLPYKGQREIVLNGYTILKRTPKGAWIEANGDRKFINLTANKRFACETEQEAVASFIARKKRQIRILKSRLDDAETFLRLAQFLGESYVAHPVDDDNRRGTGRELVLSY